MTTLQERQLRFDFPGVLRAWHLDESRKARKLAGSWCSVDFVVETKDFLLLIEVKDPGGPHVPQKERMNFVKILRTLGSKDNNKARDAFLAQYRDKFLHSLAFLGIDEGVPKKPLHYVIFISINESLLLIHFADRLKDPGRLGPVDEWSKDFDVSVLNFTQWNAQMPPVLPNWKVRRVI